MSYADELRKHARIAVLRFLKDAPKYTSNASMLSTQLPLVGINYTRDQVSTEVHWLRDQGFVTLETHAAFVVVEATQRGVEIAEGIAVHPEIQRPHPGA